MNSALIEEDESRINADLGILIMIIDAKAELTETTILDNGELFQTCKAYCLVREKRSG